MMDVSSPKLIAKQEEWNGVLKELDSESVKLASYDITLVPLLGDVEGKHVLDYGAGPGVLALALSKLRADVKAWDVNQEMRDKSGTKIGIGNVYQNIDEIPRSFFDVIICNLVLCIVPEADVRTIVENIQKFLSPKGLAYIGFCNPKIFSVPESNLDFRFTTGDPYEKNHEYKKIKKEGGYQIIETHRPIEWYERVYQEAGLQVSQEHFTPEYELKGNKIKDFIIFELRKPGL